MGIRKLCGLGALLCLSLGAASLPTSIGITGGNNQIAPINTTLPLALTVVVTGSNGVGIGGVTVEFAVTTGAGSLSAPAVQTASNGTASVVLTFGPVQGNVTVTAAIAGSAVSPVKFAETATANSACPIGPPVISTVNFATDFGGFSNFSSGSYLEIKGASLALDARPWTTSDFQGSNAPTVLDGTKVSINGTPAYVSYISADQVNVQAPADASTGFVPIVVTNCAGPSNTVTLMKNTVTPGMLAPASFNIGKQYLVALFASDLAQGLVTYVGNTGSISGVSLRPAKPGDVIALYGLGFGSVTPATPPGTIASGATNLTGVSVTFGSTPAAISYAGLDPTFVGLYEFYVTVPNISNGDTQVLVSVNGTTAVQTFYLTIQR